MIFSGTGRAVRGNTLPGFLHSDIGRGRFFFFFGGAFLRPPKPANPWHVWRVTYSRSQRRAMIARIDLRCLSTRRRRAVYMFARLFSRSRPLLGNFAAPARPREQMPVVRASGSTSSRGVWRDPATATASCWLQRTTANAVEPCVSHACVLPGKCKAQACFLLVSYRR